MTHGLSGVFAQMGEVLPHQNNKPNSLDLKGQLHGFGQW